ncbi:MAG: hypothetical protein AB7G06_01415 [Bdellovibrionales bacterium]
MAPAAQRSNFRRGARLVDAQSNPLPDTVVEEKLAAAKKRAAKDEPAVDELVGLPPDAYKERTKPQGMNRWNEKQLTNAWLKKTREYGHAYYEGERGRRDLRQLCIALDMDDDGKKLTTTTTKLANLLCSLYRWHSALLPEYYGEVFEVIGNDHVRASAFAKALRAALRPGLSPWNAAHHSEALYKGLCKNTIPNITDTILEELFAASIKPGDNRTYRGGITYDMLSDPRIGAKIGCLRALCPNTAAMDTSDHQLIYTNPEHAKMFLALETALAKQKVPAATRLARRHAMGAYKKLLLLAQQYHTAKAAEGITKAANRVKDAKRDLSSATRHVAEARKDHAKVEKVWSDILGRPATTPAAKSRAKRNPS